MSSGKTEVSRERKLEVREEKERKVGNSEVSVEES
jgi:hypothetical protein